MKLRTYIVRTIDGVVHRIEALYAFDNSNRGEGLIFRGPTDDESERRTRVVAHFAPESWAYFMEEKPETKVDPGVRTPVNEITDQDA